ncbi:MAG: chorismate-binding protein [Mariniphaga sp.]|nr:chorismate-binding protein [Mariniphaga sp.]MDD4424682.1 chorismate-binding protein [Mariniphaga sp.]
MNEKKDLAPFIDKLLSKNYSFALWSKPGSHIPEIIIPGEKGIIYPKKLNALNGHQGFIFAPYTISDHSPMVCLEPGIYCRGVSEILSMDYSSLEKKEEVCTEEPASPYIISRPAYLNDIEAAVEHIKHSGLAKVILSRIIPFQRQNESIGALFMQICRQTPNAFTYLVNLPVTTQKPAQMGLWIGATPEVLLRSQGKDMETVSLAGTQSRIADDNYSWHTKEIEEQAFVSRYLLDVFYRFNIHSYKTRGPITIESGKVAHLSTSFRFAAKKLTSGLGDFITELHPTPAICGYPKQKAATYISTVEKHDRRYYTGFLGPWRLHDEIGIYVNLRCMEVYSDWYYLYSGAGITSRSVPDDEWEETNKKANTLLSAIEAIQNK